jgi:hypothetical protein
MIQKEYKNNKSAGEYFLVAGIFCLIFAASPASAQQLTPMSASSVGLNEALGTPIDEMISAAASGGLSGAQNFSVLKQDDDQAQVFEGAVAGASDPPADDFQFPVQSPSPAFSSDSLKDLESQGGLSSALQADSSETPTVFNLAVKFFEKVVFKKDVEFANRPIFDKGLDISGQPTFDKDTAGYAIIGKGNQSVRVDFDHDYDSPPVVTATLSLQQYKDPDVRSVAEDLLFISDVKYIITNVSKKGFEIMMNSKADSDIPFSWHALAVSDPVTAKKKGEKLKSSLGSDLGSNNSAASPSSDAGTDFSAATTASAAQSETPQAPSAPDASLSPSAN